MSAARVVTDAGFEADVLQNPKPVIKTWHNDLVNIGLPSFQPSRCWRRERPPQRPLAVAAR